MASTLEQYREAKDTYLRLHTQAKKDLLARFHQLEEELLGMQRELRDDFGVKVAIRTKGRPKKTAARPGKSAAPAAAGNAVKSTARPAVSPEVARIEKKLVLQRQKLEQAAKAGKPDQSVKDRIYELEDELRLARDR